MPLWVNPFKKHDVSEFEGVFQPLSEARRHPSVVAAHSAVPGTKDEYPSEKTVEEGESDQYSANTMEALRAEIDTDIAASGHDTIYDRML